MVRNTPESSIDTKVQKYKEYFDLVDKHIKLAREHMNDKKRGIHHFSLAQDYLCKVVEETETRFSQYEIVLYELSQEAEYDPMILSFIPTKSISQKSYR